MYILRLFTTDDLVQPVDARLLRDGTLTLGRDQAADWVMSDTECSLSRWHCEFTGSPAGLSIRSMGANGVFDAASGARLPEDSIELVLPASLKFGPYVLVADHAAQSGGGDADDGQTLILSPPLGRSVDVPSDYSDAPGQEITGNDGSLLDAFCEGAGLDVSAFSLEAPDDIMRRAGAVYRQMVLGVGDLMAERERMRRQYQIAGTTIGGSNNNPFKWAPTQRLALDLLLAEERGFLSGPAALKASFKDIKKHLIATFSGLRQSLRAAVHDFDPSCIGEVTKGATSLLKSQASLNWEEACRRHSELARQVDGGEDGALNAVFVKAYDAAASDLESRGS